MPRIVLADKHPVLREGTRRILEEDPGIEVVGETGSGEEVLALTRRLHLDVVVMEIRLEGMGGGAVSRTLHRESPEVRVLLLSLWCPELYARALPTIGPSGYLLKNASGSELIQGVHTVHSGELVPSPELRFLPTPERGIASRP